MKFRHHPDGLIFFDTTPIPLADFVALEPAYTLPAGMIGREYVQGVRHVLYDGVSQFAGEMPWLEGDRYLANRAAYLPLPPPPSEPAPEPAPPTLDELKAARRAALERSYADALSSGFNSSALGTPHRYDSDLASQIKLVGAVGAGVDGEYECADAATGQTVFPLHTVEQMRQVLQDGARAARGYKQQLRDLLAQVAAATTAEELAAVPDFAS